MDRSVFAIVQPEECIVQFIVNKTNANEVIDMIKNGRLDCSNSGTLMVFLAYMTQIKVDILNPRNQNG